MEFETLIEVLSSIKFYSLVPHDDNRALDGLAYRYEYKAFTGFEPPLGDCTVLEVLIGIAERMSYILYDPDKDNDDQVHVWFWHLMHNLHLNSEDSYLENLDKVNVWLERNYAENGDGGLFPLRFVTKNQKEIEIWYQMQAYINEILF